MSLINEPREGTKWVLAFSDEFNAPISSPPDPKKWTHEVGGGGFGNNELQSYTAGSKNAFHDGKGHLIIEARKEPTTGPDGIAREYSSARLVTRGKFSQAYGRFEARIKQPIGQGIWPAFWLLGDDIGHVGWPTCGEVDIMEYRGQHPKVQVGSAHGPGYSGDQCKSGKTELKEGTLADGYHTYAIEWEPNQIRWFLDDHCYHTVTPADLGGKKWVYDHPFFIILNMAVGGNYGGNPDATTQLPQRLTVDWVKVFRKA
ncbi:glycoside hydrolase family 16 protein [Fimbriimonas ginsengisoli]|uniref:Glycoside hydrolase family protein n=1 Tax=Fimbriimonas ginsengisoli Gsoil 348 TaxID=661478 RepID=A0A068NS33_FIMGI|nr:glycoside hydrolase family 16 protein [Fimbriimonas ginsengisoli]AIE86147.1 glycoside hydrolase family protein [Fimbriimonas ginsengisoli Gsoil 348]